MIYPTLKWDPQDKKNCKIVGNIEGFDIYSKALGNKRLFALLDDDGNLLSYIIVGEPKEHLDYLPLHRIENLSGVKGLATTLAAGIKNLKAKFVINADEKLTLSGLNWVISLINSGRHGFIVTDQNGNCPDIQQLIKERGDAIITGDSGPTTLFIECNNRIKSQLAKNNHIWLSESILKPAYLFLGDPSLL